MNIKLIDGLIVKALGGFYYVESQDGVIYECRAKGVFRKKETSPLVGDKVTIEASNDNKGTVSIIHDRKNQVLRPPMANLDKIFIVVSICDPKPNTLIIDKFIAMSENKGIEPIIVITKCDLQDPSEIESIYKNSGFKVLCVNNFEKNFVNEAKNLLKDSICAFTGNTGVGKSSFINSLYPELNIKTAQISKKLGRGRHTTRHVELYKLDDINAYVADTPGFSSMDLMRYDIILKDDLQYCFREFEQYIGQCKFTGCSHTSEKGCAVLKALEEGKIEKSRHLSYLSLFDEAKNIKEWEVKKQG